MPVPLLRISAVNDAPVRADRDVVLYWMIAERRVGWSFGLDRAVERAVALRKPLWVLEGLRVDYQWASDRHHGVVLGGMSDNQRALADFSGVTYYPYVERAPGEGRGLLAALAGRAAVVVTDEAPGTPVTGMIAAAGRRLDVLLEAVDGRGLLPLRATERDYPTAHAFRRHLHKTLPGHLSAAPAARPLVGADLPPAPPVPEAVRARWPPASDALLATDPAALRALPIDHGVGPVRLRGGAVAARGALQRFIVALDGYAERRNEPEAAATSGLSTALHWGHLSAHEVFASVAAREGWTAARLASKPTGSREGWWGMGPSAEAFLDELVTWRELGAVFCHHRADFDRYDGLPLWALKTLADHADDPRDPVYDAAVLEAGRTHDPLWNAAQGQLRAEGVIHNYLRMLWGKKVLQWTRSPREAFDLLVHLNNKYATDGRDPNSYSGIAWVFGRFDRAWGPERPIFGKVRYMTSENTARKVSVKTYIARYGRPQVGG